MFSCFVGQRGWLHVTFCYTKIQYQCPAVSITALEFQILLISISPYGNIIYSWFYCYLLSLLLSFQDRSAATDHYFCWRRKKVVCSVSLWMSFSSKKQIQKGKFLPVEEILLCSLKQLTNKCLQASDRTF